MENTLIPVPSPEAIPAETGFNVHLSNFDGPFDLLLQLISRHKLDITEVSLSLVTDEFISFIRKLEESGEGWRLDQATEFLVIAATLLDLKAARLLPSGEIEDEEDLAILEARDILFARLLQYRAFKEIAASFQEAILAADKVRSFLNPNLKLIGILATMYERKTVHNREVLTAILEKYPEDVFETIIAKTIRFSETTVAGEPITAYASSSGGAQSYRRLARELIARGGAR